jgi:hypothetical protein
MRYFVKQASFIVAAAAGMGTVVPLQITAAAQAQEHQQVQPVAPQPPEINWFASFYSQPSAPGLNWQLFNRSGTLGRQGLGASPFHPEGPGNVSY